MSLHSRLRSFFHRDQLDREMAEEMRAHIEDQTQRNLAAGMSEDDARAAARREFGGVAQIQEQARDVRGLIWLERLKRDLRYALRSLRRSPGFTIVMVLTLALGIGANTAVFSVVNALLLRPPTGVDPSRLYAVTFENPDGLTTSPAIWYPFFRAYQQEARSFSELTGYLRLPMWTGYSARFQSTVEIVGGNYFSTLGIRPFRGRFFGPAEDEVPDRDAVVVIGHDLWQSHFGGRDEVIGTQLPVNILPDAEAQEFTIIGVAPPGFKGLERPEGSQLWVPAAMGGSLTPRKLRDLPFYLVGRLAPGVSREQAAAELDTITARLGEIVARNGYPGFEQYFGSNPAVLRPAARGSWLSHRADRDSVSRLAALFQGAVGFVLLISCATAANLLLARMLRRRREIALRLALGAGKLALIRPFVMECLLITATATALGLIFAKWCTDALLALRSGHMLSRVPINAELVSPDLRVAAFATLVGLATVVGFGLAPILQALRFNVDSALKDTPTAKLGGRRFNLRNLLVVAQVSLCLVLLAGAGLCLRSFVKLASVDPGLDLDVLAVHVNRTYPSREARTLFKQQLAAHLRSLPGIHSVARSGGVPLSGGGGYLLDTYDNEAFADKNRIEDYQKRPGERIILRTMGVGPGFFRTLGIPVVRGREFNTDEDARAEREALVNQAFVRRFWPERDPLGKHVLKDREVIGVVADARVDRISDPQAPTIYINDSILNSFVLLVKTQGPPEAFAETLRTELDFFDSSMNVLRSLDTLRNVLAESLGAQRMLMIVTAAFAGLTALMATLGLYGLMAYMVEQRTREIGIRVAVGAQRSDVIALILQRGLGLTVVGIACGLAAAWGLTRFLESLLYDLSPTDPLTFALIAVGFTGIAALACLLPARRATKVDPVIALRAE